MPLGDAWSGVCLAALDSEWRPDARTMERNCNFGYAREKCGRVPYEVPDAVRFTIAFDRDGVIGVEWVMEKDHLPFAHGPLAYSRDAAGFVEAHPDTRLTQQARAYVASYLRRQNGSAHA